MNALNIYSSLSHLKVHTSRQPSYLQNLISLHRPRSTRSSSVVTLSRPPTISSLKITNRSFRYASPRLWNNSLIHSVSIAGHVSTHLLIHLSPHLCHHHHSSSITSLLFHSRLKTYFFQQILPTLIDFFYFWTAFVIMGLYQTYHAHQFIFGFSFTFFDYSMW